MKLTPYQLSLISGRAFGLYRVSADLTYAEACKVAAREFAKAEKAKQPKAAPAHDDDATPANSRQRLLAHLTRIVEQIYAPEPTPSPAPAPVITKVEHADPLIDSAEG